MAKRNSLPIWLFLCSCQYDIVQDDPSCDPRTLLENELRFRPLYCGEEHILNGDSRRGDWLLENNQVRLSLRAFGSSLSNLEGSGGTIIDFAQPNGLDGLLELQPWDDGPIQSTSWTVDVSSQSIEILYPEHQFSITLGTDQPWIQFNGGVDWLFVPKAGTEVLGQLIIPPDRDYVYATDAEIQDLGGHLLLLNPTILTIGDPNEIFSNMEQSEWFEDSLDAEELYFFEEDKLLGRLSTEDGIVNGAIPSRATHLQAVRNGCISGQISQINGPIDEIGNCGSIGIRIRDLETDVAANFYGIDGLWHIPKQGLIFPFAQTISEAILHAGPAYESLYLTNIDPLSDPRLELFLDRVIPEAALVTPLLIGSPDPSQRRASRSLIEESIGLHSQLAVYSANDIIASRPVNIPAQDQVQLIAQTGLRSNTNTGTILSWPWIQKTKRAYGALPVTGITDEQIIGAALKENRMVAVDWSIWNSIDHNQLFATPQMIILRNADELSDFLQNLDPSKDISVIGPYTWLSDLSSSEKSSATLLRHLSIGPNSAGNGPMVQMKIIQSDERETLLSISVHAPLWMELNYVALYSEHGEIKRWNIDSQHFYVEHRLPSPEILSAATFGITERDIDGELSWALSRPYNTQN